MLFLLFFFYTLLYSVSLQVPLEKCSIHASSSYPEQARGCVKTQFYGLKAPKSTYPKAAPWVYGLKTAMRPVRAKALIINAFALTGRIVIYDTFFPRVLPWAMSFCPLRGALSWLLSIYYSSTISSCSSSNSSSTGNSLIGIWRLMAALNEITVSERDRPRGCNLSWMMLSR